MGNKFNFTPLPGWMVMNDWQNLMPNAGQLTGSGPPDDSVLLVKTGSSAMIMLSPLTLPPYVLVAQAAKTAYKSLGRSGNVQSPLDVASDDSHGGFSFVSPDGMNAGQFDIRRLPDEPDQVVICFGIWSAEDQDENSVEFELTAESLTAH